MFYIGISVYVIHLYNANVLNLLLQYRKIFVFLHLHIVHYNYGKNTQY